MLSMPPSLFLFLCRASKANVQFTSSISVSSFCIQSPSLLVIDLSTYCLSVCYWTKGLLGACPDIWVDYDFALFTVLEKLCFFLSSRIIFNFRFNLKKLPISIYILSTLPNRYTYLFILFVAVLDIPPRPPDLLASSLPESL